MFSQVLSIALLAVVAPPAASDYFAISVVDDATGRGVPLVLLRTVDGSRYWTDSAGRVAFHQPGLMNRKVYFHVESDGYEFPADGFGFRGKALVTTPGKSAELRITRRNLAERLYRVTGAGIYRDTVLLGRDAPIKHPLLNAEVTGSDSVNSIVLGDRIYWFWGDTNRPAYPLGNFHVPGATSRLPSDGGLQPDVGVDLDYFVADDGFAASTCKMPGDGPTWIDGVCKVTEDDGRQRLLAKYVKVRKFLDVYERGLVEFDLKKRRFEKVVTYDFEAPLYPLGHVLEQDVDGKPYLYFGNPYPLVRVPATAAALADPNRFETFTCLMPESSPESPEIDRDDTGAVRYRWRTNARPLSAQVQKSWIESGKLKSEEAILALRDVDTGRPVAAHAGSVSYNEFRRRYVMIAEEVGGSSYLGEVWYAEADTPLGPWVYARKIVTHAKYSFYNPRQHPMLDAAGGRRIYFEGTYSTFFSGVETPTPRYDYNQIMYSLRLDDPRLTLPVAVYRESHGKRQTLHTRHRGGQIAFMAADLPGEGLVPVGAADANDGSLRVLSGERERETVAFYAMPADMESAPRTTAPLYAWVEPATGRRWYGTGDQPGPAGYERDEKPLCRVWRYPLSISLPRH